MMEVHRLHAELLGREVRILVVGCGGTGSAVLGGLPYLHQAMLAQGHPSGLSVTVMDGDVVSPANCVRQPFSCGEVGLNKGIVLISRINLFWGFKWKAIPHPLTAETLSVPSSSVYETALRPDIVVGCVDTRAARAIIAACTAGRSGAGYLARCRQQRFEWTVRNGRAVEREEQAITDAVADGSRALFGGGRPGSRR
ncbi:MAG: ThiF family adenylyltransferase [Bryobacteraceae bacterium]